MGFRTRWTSVLLGLFFIALVFMIPRQYVQKCKCQDDHAEGVIKIPVDKMRPHHVETDLETIGHKTVTKKTLHLAQKETLLRNNIDVNITRSLDSNKEDKRLQIDGWILDCVTWEKKWEMSSMESDPHPFEAQDHKLGQGEDPVHRQNTFQEIFDRRDWPAKDLSYSGLQSSGPGAMLRNAQGAIAVLHSVVTKLKSHLRKPEISLLDIPCGDLQWMSKFLLTRSDIHYTGMDIVPDLIHHHRKTFSRIPKAQFLEWDIVKHPLNESYDLIFSRDMLQHLWRADAMQALHKISQSHSTFVLLTNFPDSTSNPEVEKDGLGGRRSPFNLELPPFLLPPPICMTYDWNVEHLALWPLPLLQKSEY